MYHAVTCLDKSRWWNWSKEWNPELSFKFLITTWPRTPFDSSVCLMVYLSACLPICLCWNQQVVPNKNWGIKAKFGPTYFCTYVFNIWCIRLYALHFWAFISSPSFSTGLYEERKIMHSARPIPQCIASAWTELTSWLPLFGFVPKQFPQINVIL